MIPARTKCDDGAYKSGRKYAGFDLFTVRTRIHKLSHRREKRIRKTGTNPGSEAMSRVDGSSGKLSHKISLAEAKRRRQQVSARFGRWEPRRVLQLDSVTFSSPWARCVTSLLSTDEVAKRTTSHAFRSRSSVSFCLWQPARRTLCVMLRWQFYCWHVFSGKSWRQESRGVGWLGEE